MLAYLGAAVVAVGLLAPVSPAEGPGADAVAAGGSEIGRIDAVPYTAVRIGGPFWAARLAAVREGTLEANRHQCEITGRIANFENAARKLHPKAGEEVGAYQGYLFNDSDVYKMMQGWACLIATEGDAAKKRALDADLDGLIAKVAAAQMADGYIDTYYTLKAGIENRFTREEWDHETYCMGHLIEAGAEHFVATGKRNLVDVSVRAADFLRGLYGPEKFTAPPGHEELELALLALAESGAVSAEKREAYIAFAHELVEYRGRPHRKLDGTVYGPWGEYAQDHKPAVEQMEAAGHAVRAGYLYAAMADLARLGAMKLRSGSWRGEAAGAEYGVPLTHLWEDITQRRIFVTGGIGPSGSNEGFTVPYDIPTRSAYQETCASIALCLWAHRMFLLGGEAKYMEQFERTLYNAALAGVSLDGKQFFYVNPMACVLGAHARRAWFDCACCPPNVLRFFAGMGRYVYSVRERDGAAPTLFVNLFAESRATVKVGGQAVEIEQVTGYPFDGGVRISVKNPGGGAIDLAIRAGSGGRVTAGPKHDLLEDGYVHMTLSPGENRIEWSVPMEAHRVYSDPRVKATFGRAAVMRGPLVYAAESVDNQVDSGAGGNGDGGVSDFVMPAGSTMTETVGADGVPVVVAEGVRVTGGTEGSLYRAGAATAPAKLVLRPYFMWANRGRSEMRVWFPESAGMMDPRPPKGVKLSASFVGNGDGVGAMMDGIEPESSGDGTVPRMTFWPHKGVKERGKSEEWVECRFDVAREVSRVGVYWFDDTGVGECRVPRGAEVEYLNGEAWKPVAGEGGGAGIGVTKDMMNERVFTPVKTLGVRVRVTLQEKMSAGILEWKVGR